MERLTEWYESSHKHAYYPRCFEGPCYGRGCEINDCPFETAVCERLAAYEDTGLMPEEVLPKDKADEIALKLMRLADLESLCSYDHLRELAEADKDGRVLILPCNVGDMAYWAHNGVITGCHVYRIQVNRKGTFVFLKSTISHGGFRTDACLGKTVFLSREEAEKALQEMEGKA